MVLYIIFVTHMSQCSEICLYIIIFKKITILKIFRNLKFLQRGINSCLTAMSTYDISTQSWDPILVFICIQRLPSNTVNLWEQSVKDKSALSLWKDLDHFLTERAQTLDCLRDLRSSEPVKKAPEHKIKAHHTNAASASTTSCILCKNQINFLRSCHRFKSLSISDRYSTIKKFHCCVNCLSRAHEAKNCNSTFNCSICNKRHHTMLHQELPHSDSSIRENNNSKSGASPVLPPRHTNSIPQNSFPSSFAAETMALVLSKISVNLPSFPIPSHFKENFGWHI